MQQLPLRSFVTPVERKPTIAAGRRRMMRTLLTCDHWFLFVSLNVASFVISVRRIPCIRSRLCTYSAFTVTEFILAGQHRTLMPYELLLLSSAMVLRTRHPARNIEKELQHATHMCNTYRSPIVVPTSHLSPQAPIILPCFPPRPDQRY